MASNSSNVTNPPSDPVRWWPSGMPQGAGVVATAIGTYAALAKIGALNPRVRVLFSLAAAGVSGSTIAFLSVLENSVGFNRLMWGMSEYNRSKNWPSVDLAYLQSEARLKEFAEGQMKSLTPADQAVIDSVVKEATSSSTTTNYFLPSSDAVSNLLIELYENLFRVVIIKTWYSSGSF